MTRESSKTQFKKCKSCQEVKASADFYFHKLSNAFEANCKTCKKKKRNSVQASQANSKEPEQIIEPMNGCEMAGSFSDLDFSIWERLYKRSLSEVEKLEISNNILQFADILLSEHRAGEGTAHEDNK